MNPKDTSEALRQIRLRALFLLQAEPSNPEVAVCAKDIADRIADLDRLLCDGGELPKDWRGR